MEGNPYEHDPKDVELENEISHYLRNMREGDLRVSVRHGHVTLSGTVRDYETKREISQHMHGFGGTHDLVNNIRVIGRDQTMVDQDSNI